MGLGVCFSFEAKMMDFVFTIEKALEFNWTNIWVETDSLNIVNLFRRGNGKIYWRFEIDGCEELKWRKKKNLVDLSGNSVANKLTTQAS